MTSGGGGAGCHGARSHASVDMACLRQAVSAGPGLCVGHSCAWRSYALWDVRSQLFSRASPTRQGQSHRRPACPSQVPPRGSWQSVPWSPFPSLALSEVLSMSQPPPRPPPHQGQVDSAGRTRPGPPLVQWDLGCRLGLSVPSQSFRCPTRLPACTERPGRSVRRLGAEELSCTSEACSGGPAGYTGDANCYTMSSIFHNSVDQSVICGLKTPSLIGKDGQHEGEDRCPLFMSYHRCLQKGDA